MARKISEGNTEKTVCCFYEGASAKGGRCFRGAGGLSNERGLKSRRIKRTWRKKGGSEAKTRKDIQEKKIPNLLKLDVLIHP